MEELMVLRAEKQKLLDRLIDPPKPEPVVPQELPQPVQRGPLPWALRRNILEEQDRAKANIIKEQADKAARLMDSKEVEKLEKELGVNDANK